jgi:hypothetical protein
LDLQSVRQLDLRSGLQMEQHWASRSGLQSVQQWAQQSGIRLAMPSA